VSGDVSAFGGLLGGGKKHAALPGSFVSVDREREGGREGRREGGRGKGGREKR